MVGADWRGYELLYYDYNDYSSGRFEKNGEIGFVYLIKYFSKVIKDFWIFNALTKIIYTLVLVKFFSNFTKYRWTALGVSILAGSTLFMVIDCPMRFMLGGTMLLIGLNLYLKELYIYSIIFVLLSLIFHQTYIIIILILLTYKLSDFFWPSNRMVIIGLYLGLNLIILYSPLYDYLYNSLIPFFGMDTYMKSYSFAGTSSFFQLGNIKELVLLIFILYSKKLLVNIPNGKYVYYFGVLYFFLSLILRCIPTGFRLAIVFGYFTTIYLTIIFTSISWKIITKRTVYNLTVVLLLIAVYVRTLDKSFSYLPYSNSIPYILTEHLPYEYRSNHNLDAYQARTGKKIYIN